MQCFRLVAMHLRLPAVQVPMLAGIVKAMSVQQWSSSMHGICPPARIWLLPQRVSLELVMV